MEAHSVECGVCGVDFAAFNIGRYFESGSVHKHLDKIIKSAPIEKLQGDYHDICDDCYTDQSKEAKFYEVSFIHMDEGESVMLELIDAMPERIEDFKFYVPTFTTHNLKTMDIDKESSKSLVSFILDYVSVDEIIREVSAKDCIIQNDII